MTQTRTIASVVGLIGCLIALGALLFATPACTLSCDTGEPCPEGLMCVEGSCL